MDIDSVISDCLKSGQIHISSYQGDYFCATVNFDRKEVARVFSNKGVYHLLLKITAVVTGKEVYSEQADALYRYSLGPMSVERNNSLFQIARVSSVFIFCIGDIVHVQQHVSTMQKLNGEVGPSYRYGLGYTFSSALHSLLNGTFKPTTCVSENPV